MDLNEAKEIVAQSERLAEAKEVLREAAQEEAYRKQRALELAMSYPHGEEEEPALLAAIALLERLRADLLRDPPDDVRRTIHWIDNGVYVADQGLVGLSAERLAAVLQRPEIARFHFKAPGLAAFERRLRSVREERKAS